MQVADIFTKPIGQDQFCFIRRKLGMIDYRTRIKVEHFLLIFSMAKKLIFKALDFDNLENVKSVEVKSFHILILGILLYWWGLLIFNSLLLTETSFLESWNWILKIDLKSFQNWIRRSFGNLLIDFPLFFLKLAAATRGEQNRWNRKTEQKNQLIGAIFQKKKGSVNRIEKFCGFNSVFWN